MSLRVEVDETCMGYGNCVVTAPQVFDLDPATGAAVLRAGHPTDDDEGVLVEAEADCPARAIRLRRDHT